MIDPIRTDPVAAIAISWSTELAVSKPPNVVTGIAFVVVPMPFASVPIPPGALIVTLTPETKASAPAVIDDATPLVVPLAVRVVLPCRLLMWLLTTMLAVEVIAILLVPPPVKLMPIGKSALTLLVAVSVS